MGNNNDPITNVFKKMNETPEQTEDRLAREKANAQKWAKLILDEAKEPDSQQVPQKSDLISIPLKVLGFIAFVNILALVAGKHP
jgi:hypothetical protein